MAQKHSSFKFNKLAGSSSEIVQAILFTGILIFRRCDDGYYQLLKLFLRFWISSRRHVAV